MPINNFISRIIPRRNRRGTIAPEPQEQPQPQPQPQQRPPTRRRQGAIIAPEEIAINLGNQPEPRDIDIGRARRPSRQARFQSEIQPDPSPNIGGRPVVPVEQPNGDVVLGVKEFKKGGLVKKTGLAKVHKGELVIPANRVKAVEKAVKNAGLKPLKK